MLLSDFNVYFIDTHVIFILILLFIWFIFQVLNYLLWIVSLSIYKNYQYILKILFVC